MANKSSPHGGFICEGTIIHGTLRGQDLLRAFADELERVFPFNGFSLAYDAREAANDLDKDEVTEKQHDNAANILDRLFDQLGEIAAREGMWFGNLEGDGSDFGWWAEETADEDA